MSLIPAFQMYFTLPLIFIGASIASASWVFLSLSITLAITHFYNAIPEERVCLEAHGNAYGEYMNRTSRWVGMPKPNWENFYSRQKYEPS
jgi:protein-S-isoprenylcysteine O-methyltransferase Ste14